MKKGKYLIVLHVVGWLLFLLLPIAVVSSLPEMPFQDQESRNNPYLFFFILFGALLVFFYLNAFALLPKLFFNNRKMAYWLSIGLSLLLFLFISVQIAELIKPQFKFPNHFTPPPESPEFRMQLESMPTDGLKMVMPTLLFLFIWAISSLLHIIGRYQHERERNREMAMEQKVSELSYLKAQIHPHFLFNSLNSIYALAISQHTETADAIVKLSDIMRYVTQDAGALLVPLEKEIDYLSNYIDLQQLRCNDKVELQYSVKGDLKNHQIAPLLLISFIENAFKYGISNHEPSQIRIHIRVHEGTLDMLVGNSIHPSFENSDGTATGLHNTSRRLELQYPNKYQLTINQQPQYYEIHLFLQLI